MLINSHSRRKFFRKIFGYASLVFAGSYLGKILNFVDVANAQATKPYLDMSGKNGDKNVEKARRIAMGLHYVEDAALAEHEGLIKRSQRPSANGKPLAANQQKCSSCQLYREIEFGKSGECALLAGVLVSGNGWCNSWMQSMKPAKPAKKKH